MKHLSRRCGCRDGFGSGGLWEADLAELLGSSRDIAQVALGVALLTGLLALVRAVLAPHEDAADQDRGFRMLVPENLAAQIPEIMPVRLIRTPAVLPYPRDPGVRDWAPEIGRSVYSDRKREDVRLLLAASVPSGRIAKRTRTPLRTIRRIARDLSEPAAPAARAASSRPSMPMCGPPCWWSTNSATSATARRHQCPLLGRHHQQADQGLGGRPARLRPARGHLRARTHDLLGGAFHAHAPPDRD